MSRTCPGEHEYIPGPPRRFLYLLIALSRSTLCAVKGGNIHGMGGVAVVVTELYH